MFLRDSLEFWSWLISRLSSDQLIQDMKRSAAGKESGICGPSRGSGGHSFLLNLDMGCAVGEADPRRHKFVECNLVARAFFGVAKSCSRNANASP